MESQQAGGITNVTKNVYAENVGVINNNYAAAPPPEAAPLFNQYLIRNLLTAIADKIPRAEILRVQLGTKQVWSDANYSEVGQLLISSYSSLLGALLQNLTAIGAAENKQNEDGARWVKEKIEDYISNCIESGRQSLQLMCFILLSDLWGQIKEQKISGLDSVQPIISNFFNFSQPFEIDEFFALLICLAGIYQSKELLKEQDKGSLLQKLVNLADDDNFKDACAKLIDLRAKGENINTAANCTEIELQLTRILSSLSFFVRYKRLSIRGIGYDRNISTTAGYLQNFVELDASIGKVKANFSPDLPKTIDAVLLVKKEKNRGK